MHNEIKSLEINGGRNENYFIIQIISAGVTTANVYEVQLILAPEVDMSTLKITVKSNNLRVAVNLSPNFDNKFTNEVMLKSISKYAENFLMPNFIDIEQVRAIADYHKRLLTLIAPPLKNL